MSVYGKWARNQHHMEMRHRQLSLLTSFLFVTSQVWAAPSNTMSVTPACTSGTTITCSDETTRNNNISTPYNSHTHTDIAAMTGVNTFTIGDNAAGNKDYCEDGATDRCLRYNSSADLWTIQQGGTSYNQVVTFSGTAGIGSGFVLAGNGTGAVVALTSAAPADDSALVGDSASAATWRSLPNCTDTSGNHLNYTTATNAFSCGTTRSAAQSSILTHSRTAAAGSGAQAITGMGFAPTTLWMNCITDNALRWSLGFGEDGNGEAVGMFMGGNTNAQRSYTDIAYVDDGAGNIMKAVLTTLDSDGFTLTWTKVAAGVEVTCATMGVR